MITHSINNIEPAYAREVTGWFKIVKMEVLQCHWIVTLQHRLF